MRTEKVAGFAATTKCVPEDTFRNDEGVRRAIRKVVAKLKSAVMAQQHQVNRANIAKINQNFFDGILQPNPEQTQRNRKRWLERRVSQYNKELGRMFAAEHLKAPDNES